MKEETQSPRVDWEEYPEDTDLSEDFLEGKSPSEVSEDEIRSGSACSEGGCE